ncbi:MAG: YihY family inner membrane protein [Pseudomonadales bacterium]|jgi:membrane protein|nr:YihY family inner membrane protein [Pseudomonadales bacterium]MDA0762070.1 YihY family inner membrane protein [Pseudomonadota bacterium]MDA0958016.1 YihY family inner membrane protein [Pseudomonadota bacterium]MDA1207041.1 YihY family inner membrane protein [Pseudomonadota bacterium]
MKGVGARLVISIMRCYKQFKDDRCQVVAGALTLQTLFAIVPAITIGYLSLATFGGLGQVDASIETFLFSYIVPESVGSIRAYLKQFSTQAQSLSIPSAILLAVTALLMLNTVERTLNDIWQVKSPRSGFSRLLIYLGLLILGPVLLFSGLSVSIYVLSMPYLKTLVLSQPFLFLFPLLTSSAMYTLLYFLVPSARVPLIHAMLGGVGVALIFELARFGFGLLMQYSSITLVYGAFAALPGLLLWLYMAWLIILAGAEVVAYLGARGGKM